MFVFIIMSHGKRGDIILDVDKKPVDLVTIYKLLSPANFPAMAGKPKMVIIQACSGGKNLPYFSLLWHNWTGGLTIELYNHKFYYTDEMDYGDGATSADLVQTSNVDIPVSKEDRDITTVHKDVQHLTNADFMIMKASSEGEYKHNVKPLVVDQLWFIN